MNGVVICPVWRLWDSIIVLCSTSWTQSWIAMTSSNAQCTSRHVALVFGQMRVGNVSGAQGPPPLTSIFWICAFIFCRTQNSLTERTNKNKNASSIFRRQAAPKDWEVEARPKRPISGLRGFITALGTQRRSGAFLCQKGPIMGPKWQIFCLNGCIFGLRCPIRTWEVHSRS